LTAVSRVSFGFSTIATAGGATGAAAAGTSTVLTAAGAGMSAPASGGMLLAAEAIAGFEPGAGIGGSFLVEARLLRLVARGGVTLGAHGVLVARRGRRVAGLRQALGGGVLEAVLEAVGVGEQRVRRRSGRSVCWAWATLGSSCSSPRRPTITPMANTKQPTTDRPKNRKKI
jgi:hypothetical protein